MRVCKGSESLGQLTPGKHVDVDCGETGIGKVGSRKNKYKKQRRTITNYPSVYPSSMMSRRNRNPLHNPLHYATPQLQTGAPVTFSTAKRVLSGYDYGMSLAIQNYHFYSKRPT